jgi:hypothetical protein
VVCAERGDIRVRSVWGRGVWGGVGGGAPGTLPRGRRQGSLAGPAPGGGGGGLCAPRGAGVTPPLSGGAGRRRSTRPPSAPSFSSSSTALLSRGACKRMRSLFAQGRRRLGAAHARGRRAATQCRMHSSRRAADTCTQERLEAQPPRGAHAPAPAQASPGGGDRRPSSAPLPPLPRTNRTSLVPPLVLSGHALSAESTLVDLRKKGGQALCDPAAAPGVELLHLHVPDLGPGEVFSQLG